MLCASQIKQVTITTGYLCVGRTKDKINFNLKNRKETLRPKKSFHRNSQIYIN